MTRLIVQLLAVLLFPAASHAVLHDDLFAAVAGNDPAKVTEILDRGGDVNFHDRAERTLLCIAVENGFVEMVKLLIDRGADVDATGTWRRDTALHHLPLDETGIAAAKILIEAGADPNKGDRWDLTPLHVNAMRSAALTKLLLNAGANPDSAGVEGWTPLHLAATSRSGERAKIVRLLLDAGANPWSWDALGLPPVFVVLLWPATAREELEHVAGLRVPEFPFDESKHETPCDDSAEVVRMFLETAPSDDDRYGILVTAAAFGRAEAVELLLAQKVPPVRPSADDFSPLHAAAGWMLADAQKKGAKTGLDITEETYLKITKLLVGAGANVNAVRRGPGPDETPLDIATEAGHEKIAAYLKSEGAKPASELSR